MYINLYVRMLCLLHMFTSSILLGFMLTVQLMITFIHLTLNYLVVPRSNRFTNDVTVISIMFVI